MTPADLLDAVILCDGCAESAPALCHAHEPIARELEAQAIAAAAAAKLRRAPPTPISPQPRCRGCGVFLSVDRVAMRIERCSDCDGSRKGRRR